MGVWLSNSKRLDTIEQVKQAAWENEDRCNVKSTGDIAASEKSLKSLLSKVGSVKAELSDEQLKLKRISELIAAYEKIIEGNYIDNLVKAQRERNKLLIIYTQSNIINAREKPHLSCYASVRLVTLFAQLRSCIRIG